MSGVLDRMAKRAFGKLPTVQPLIRSIYAASPVNAGEFAAPESSPSKVDVETTAPVPAPASPRTSEPKNAAPQNPRVAVVPKAVASKIEEVRAPRDRRYVPDAPQTAATPLQEPQDEDPFRPPRSFSPQAETFEAPDRLESFAQIDSTPAAETSLPPVRSSQSTPQPIHPRRVRATGVEAALPQEQKTEIQISIGTIELRAAPADPKPAAPAPFRPRVSLQDFLNRSTGSRR
jgi:hypothetical protein